MHALIIKISSLGDIIHTLPALTDAKQAHADISFDWVVEPAFAEIPAFHPLVRNVIPIPLRRWKKNIFHTIKSREWRDCYTKLRKEKYDAIIDAQGLIKSGFLTFLTRGIKHGYDRFSAWEPLACLAYHKKYRVNPQQHAITRIRQLFGQSLNYAVPSNNPDYGIMLSHHSSVSSLPKENYCLFLHGTTREDKCWPETHWLKLIELFKTLPSSYENIKILLPWGNEAEKNRALRLAEGQSQVEVLPKLSLTDLAKLLSNSKCNIAVDTGLGHLSAALNSPTISLYGPTEPDLIGTMGKNQIHMKADKMHDIAPEAVMKFAMTPFI